MRNRRFCETGIVGVISITPEIGIGFPNRNIEGLKCVWRCID